MKQLKYLFFFMLLSMSAMCVTSCGDDEDDDIPAYDDFYIECRVSGGGLTSQEITQFQAGLNSSISEVTFTGYSKDQAIYIFDTLVKELRNSFSSGITNITGELSIVLMLKSTSGKSLKSSTLVVTKDSCRIK